MNISVKKAAIKNGLFLTYSYELTENDVTNSNTTASDAPIHDDLRHAIRNLIPFFAHICEEISDIGLIEDAIENPEVHLERKADDPEDKIYPLLKYRVTGFTIGGKADTEGVTITGNKRLDSGGIVNFNTPFMNFESDYKFIGDLYAAIENAKQEVFEYMQGKQAPKSQQLGIFEGQEEEEEETVFE